jgi:predicted HAD superfamily Cof-like phosphohydrolase|tara:strand:- start:376 stop:783 length:408 start_codon:yes stop_codon:yes gene_type:complete
MSNNWVKDIAEMHTKYGTNKAVRSMDASQLRSFLKFRVNFLQEELDELKNASKENLPIDSPEVVDALIDLCVVAIGTLDAFDVDAYKAWDVVHKANMNKEVGIKESRPNPLGLPDLIKPEGWVAPTHDDNTGLLP